MQPTPGDSGRNFSLVTKVQAPYLALVTVSQVKNVVQQVLSQTINRAWKKRPWYGLGQAGRAVIAHLEYKPINIQFFHTESDNDSHCFVLWASTYITHGDKSEFMSWVKMLQKFHPISLSVQSSHNPRSPPRLLDAVVTSERCGSPHFSSNIFLFDTLEGSFTRIQTWLPGKLDHNFVQDTDTVLD